MKTKGNSPAEAIGGAIFSAIKPLYQEGERMRRNRRRDRNLLLSAPSAETSQKEIVFEVLPEAVASAKGDAPIVGTRDLFYSTRPLCYSHPYWPEDKELDFGYFAQTLLTEYQEIYGEIVGLWRDPRGHLHEPHGDKSIELGTRAMWAYHIPHLLYDKILYVEKEGEWPKIEAAKIAERYDMAVAAGKGYATEAARTLLEKAEGKGFQVFCFHDADIDGYNIARTLREETRRMPGYAVEVIDLGLTIAEAEEMGLEPERFSRKKGIPADLRPGLDARELEYFERRRERFELNAITPVSRRMEYIEEKLLENGVRGKLIPPDDELPELADGLYREKVAEWVDAALSDLVSLDEIKAAIADGLREEFGLENARRYIEEGFEEDDALSWRRTLTDRYGSIHEDHRHTLREAVRKHAADALAEDDG